MEMQHAGCGRKTIIVSDVWDYEIYIDHCACLNRIHNLSWMRNKADPSYLMLSIKKVGIRLH